MDLHCLQKQGITGLSRTRVNTAPDTAITMAIILNTVTNLSIYLDRKAFANSVDPDQMLQNVASHQGLHCLPYIQQYFKCIKR